MTRAQVVAASGMICTKGRMKARERRNAPPVGVWVCGCVGVWVCGCVGVWVCGCVGVL